MNGPMNRQGPKNRREAFGRWAAPTLRGWSRTAVPVLASAVALLLPLAGHAAESAADPWAILGHARETMQQGGPQLWSFSQTYLPPGFDRGEDETGRVALDLPRCLRIRTGEEGKEAIG